MATAAEISEFDTEELERQLGETRRELFNLRFQLATGQLDNFSRMSHVRKDVARMLTELRNREIAEAEGLALDQLPAHKAAARRRDEDEAKGRDKSTASERRAAARAEDEERSAAEAPATEPADDDAAEDAEEGNCWPTSSVPRARPRSGQTPGRSVRALWSPTRWMRQSSSLSWSVCATPATARPFNGPRSSTSTMERTPPRSAIACASSRLGRCRSSSAGG